MKFRQALKTLDFKQITSLIGWFLKHPLFMTATFFATYRTFRISQKHFPNIHWKHNKANAFRHVIWNVLIAKKAATFSSDDEKVLQWTKTITDWHEDFSPNLELARKMDLHNNLVGRLWYPKLKSKSVDEVTEFLIQKSEEAIQVTEVSEIVENDKMVYLGEVF